MKKLEKELLDTVHELYPYNEYGWDYALERDVEAIQDNDQGSSSFNKSMINAQDIEYVWAIEKYVRGCRK